MSTALRTLYAQGGIARFYQGLLYALMQTPLSRFGDTAANVGVLSIFASLLPGTPLGVRTAFASAAGASWRMSVICRLAAESMARDRRAGVARAGVSSLCRRNPMKPAHARRNASSVKGGEPDEDEEDWLC